MTRAVAEYIYTARDKTAEALRSVKGNVLGVDKAMSSVHKMIGLLAGGAGIGLIIKNTLEAEKVLAQLDARLKSTGGAAGLSKQELIGMAQGLQEVTTFGDEAIIGAQNLMLTFTNIGRETFPDALEAVLDMSVALDQDLKTSAMAVGKALNDPILGVTALTRMGVQFTQKQKDVIKSLVETGEVAEAQHIILAELETQMGGSARAARDTLGGAITSLGNAFGDLLEGDVEGSGLRGTTESINELTDLLQSPETKQAFAAITSMVFNLAHAMVSATAGIYEMFNSLRHQTLQFVQDIVNGMESFYDVMEDLPGNFLWRDSLTEAKDNLRAFSLELEELKLMNADRSVINGLRSPGVDRSGSDNTPSGNSKSALSELGMVSLGVFDEALAAANEKATQSIQEQVDVYKEWQIQLDEVTRTEAQRTDNINDYVGNLQRQIDTMGMSSAELVEYELRMLGASEATIEHAKAMEQQRLTMEQNLDLQRMLSEDALKAQQEVEKETKKTDDIVRQLGLTFTSAFEDAVIGGKKFRDVLQGIFSDIQRLLLRKTVTEPLLGAIEGIFSGAGSGAGFVEGEWDFLGTIGDVFGSILGDIFGGSFAHGGPVMAGVPYLVGEQGPELFMPRSSGQIIPNDKLNGGGISVVNHIDARGSQMTETRLNQILKRNSDDTIRRIQDMQARNRSFTSV